MQVKENSFLVTGGASGLGESVARAIVKHWSLSWVIVRALCAVTSLTAMKYNQRLKWQSQLLAAYKAQSTVRVS